MGEIYLDNAATSWPKAPLLGQACSDAIEDMVGNVGRSAHSGSHKGAMHLFSCREMIQDTIPPTQLEKIIFTRNATESINIALFGAVGEKDIVLTTKAEHNAVARPLRVLHERNVRVVQSHCDQYGRVDVDDFYHKLRTFHPKVAIFSAANNVTGAINPTEELIALCAQEGVPFIIDGAQAVGEIDLSFPPIDCTGALCFSLHKGLLGPAGVGIMALYGDFLPTPLWYGGTGSRSDLDIQPDFLPDRYESGTPAIQIIAASKVALSYSLSHKREIYKTRKDTSLRLWEHLATIDALRLLSPQNDRVGIVSVTVVKEGITALSQYLYDAHIAVRTGFHCAPWTHQHIGTIPFGGAIRFSVGYQTTIEDIDTVYTLIKGFYYGT